MTAEPRPLPAPPAAAVTPVVAPVAAAVAAAPARKAILPETTDAMPWPSPQEIKKESNPFTDRDWRMFTYAWAGMIVRAMVIFGVVFTVFQYIETSEEKRINKTFELLEIWERPEYQEANLAVRQRISDLNARYASLLGKDPSPTQLAVYMERVGVEAMSADGGTMPLPEFKKQFDALAFFLTRVATCVQANQCSRQVTDDYFRDLSVSFWSYFSRYVRQVRAAGSTTFAVPIEEYVTGRRPEISDPITAAERRAG